MKVTRIHALAIVVLTLWIGWTLFMWFAATRSFRTVDEVLKSPPAQFSSDVQGQRPEQTREVLRYLASEINRTYFQAYGWGQIVLGAALLLLLAWKTPRNHLEPGRRRPPALYRNHPDAGGDAADYFSGQKH